MLATAGGREKKRRYDTVAGSSWEIRRGRPSITLRINFVMDLLKATLPTCLMKSLCEVRALLPLR